MLYDEEGRVYVEPPLIPEEQHLMYIVKDYRRMYGEYWKLKVHNKKTWRDKYETRKPKLLTYAQESRTA
jgi:hypothetical protein